MTARKYAVLGAGPMGLIAAIELLKLGHQVDIYERDDRIGGMSASFDFDGLTIERYYHFICKTDAPLFALLDELGLSDKLKWTDTRMGYYYNGTLYKWGTPMALLGFPKLGLIAKLRYALQVMVTKNVSDWSALDKVSATDWLRKWLGKEGYDVLWHRTLLPEVLRVHGEPFGGLDRHADQAHRAVAQEPAAGKPGLYRRRFGHAAGPPGGSHRAAWRSHPPALGHRAGRWSRTAR